MQYVCSFHLDSSMYCRPAVCFLQKGEYSLATCLVIKLSYFLCLAWIQQCQVRVKVSHHRTADLCDSCCLTQFGSGYFLCCISSTFLIIESSIQVTSEKIWRKCEVLMAFSTKKRTGNQGTAYTLNNSGEIRCYKLSGRGDVWLLLLNYHSAESVRKVTGFRARNVMFGTTKYVVCVGTKGRLHNSCGSCQ